MATVAEVLDAAKSLPRAERAEVARELLATLGTADIPVSDRLAALRDAVNVGIEQLDRGEGIRMTVDDLEGYLRERGRLATERARAKSA